MVKYTLTETASYNRERHILVDDALRMIAAQEDSRLSPDLLSAAIDGQEIRVYEFGEKKYLDRLDIGRVYHPTEPTQGITIERFFTRSGEDPFSVMGELAPRRVERKNNDGTIGFEMDGAVFPTSWTDNEATIVAEKYFYAPNKPEWKKRLQDTIGRDYEFSPVQLIRRVTTFLAESGQKLGYFKTEGDRKAFEDELNWLQASRRFAFNSPVYFNAGIYAQYGIEGSRTLTHWKDPKTGKVHSVKEGENIKPVCHACFINGPRDDLESLMSHVADECAIFSRGSGIGHDLSAIRAEGEPLSCGGTGSGPLSFLKIYDTEAGTIKSAGKSRRAARMTTIRGGARECHADIMKFVRLKVTEDRKALALMKKGFSPGMEGEAYTTVAMQNTNLSARLDDEFFKQVETDGDIELRWVTNGNVVGKIKARRMLQEIAFGAWRVGDPGVQYESTIQAAHTSPLSGRINSSNPCSEFMNVDDTSCNLGSLNLNLFTDDKGNFDYANFKRAAKIATIALDIINSAGSYPVRDIAEVSPEFRSIGLGFSNLSTVLMKRGSPYDSDEARAYAAAITALMTASALKTSAEMARDMGTYTHFELNRKPAQRVIANQSKRARELKLEGIVSEEFAREIAATYDEAEKLGEQFGYRNSQVTLLAPTGTISSLMGCDTTGIEPPYLLVVKKDLAGGGSLNLRNEGVGGALRNLGYSEEEIQEMVEHVNKKAVMVGAPHIKPEHQRIFDTSVGDKKTRTGAIPFEGHIGMMSAAQPFLSGAISKTINFPHHATVKNFYDGIILGHRLGLKALAAFRDDSKPISVLGSNDRTYVELRRGEKEELPTRRNAAEFEVEFATDHGNIPLHIIASEYDDGRPGQITFLSYKAGSTLGALLQSAGVAASKSLRRGVKLDDILESWLDQEFEPNGDALGHPDFMGFRSALDAAAKILFLEYRGRTDLAKNPERVDVTQLRGFKNGAFRTYQRMNVDDWNFEQVIKDPELGGFVEDTSGLSAPQEKAVVKSRGLPCPKCGGVLIQDKPNCYHCEKCSNNIGGCTA